MPSLDVLNEARLAAKAATTAPTPTTPTRVNTTTLAGIEAASNPVTPSVAPVAPVAPVGNWTKASTVNTANGPVDVDANGKAEDGSVPVPVKSPVTGNKIPAGFTEGPFPKALEKFFGSSEGILGYKIETVTDKNGKTYNQLSVATGPGSSKTFGAAFTQGPNGEYTSFTPAGGSSSSASGDSALTPEQLIAKQNQDALAAAGKAERQSAFDLLYNEFNKYGLGSMVDQIKGLITDSNVNPSQFSLALQNTDAYKQRFSANQDRIKQGLRALTPAEYIGLEDQYQNVMRNYGLPASYYTKDSTGKQSGFDKFLAGDVSASELEDRIATAQQRVVNSNPEVLQALKQFYPDINNADILAYTLDPKNALDTIHRKVTAAEIGGAALAQGLQAQGGTAESLAGLGVTKAQAQQGYTNVAEMVPRGSQLSDIYNQGPYNQQTAEAEVFNTAGAATAAAKRKKLTALETASFSGSSGVGSLNRDRAVSNYMLGQPGAGSY